MNVICCNRIILIVLGVFLIGFMTVFLAEEVNLMNFSYSSDVPVYTDYRVIALLVAFLIWNIILQTWVIYLHNINFKLLRKNEECENLVN